MADIINMPNPEPKGGSGFGFIAGLGLLGAGLYIAYKKLSGNSSTTGTDGSGSGGGSWSEILGLFGGGDTSGTSGGTPTGTTSGTTSGTSSGTSGNGSSSAPPVVTPDTGSTGSASSAHAATQTTSRYLGSSYKPVSDSVESFLLAGRTEEEAAGYSKALDIADQLKLSNYVIDSTRQGGSVYNVISGTSGQVYGGGAGISYFDAVSRGVETKTGLPTITVSSSGKVTGLSNVKPTISASPVTGTVYGSGTSKSSGSTSKSSGSTSKSSGSSGSSGGGSAVSSFVSTLKSGGTSSVSTSGSSGSSGSSVKTVTTSTGFTLTSKVNTNNSAISFLRNRK